MANIMKIYKPNQPVFIKGLKKSGVIVAAIIGDKNTITYDVGYFSINEEYRVTRMFASEFDIHNAETTQIGFKGEKIG